MISKEKINIPSWAQGVLAVGILAGIATAAVKVSRRKEEKQVADMVWSSDSNPFNWRNFFTGIKAGTIVTRYTDGGVAAAKRLYDLFGYTNEDEAGIKAFFAGVQSQYQVAQIAKQMFEKNGIELTTLLTDGRSYWMPNVGGGLSKEDIAEIYRNVKSKPKLRK